MKQLKLIALFLIAIMATCLTAACSKPIQAEPLNAQIVADYTKTAEERSETFASGSMGYSWENGEPFNVWWNPENVSYEENKLSLYISEMTEKETTWDEESKTNVPCKAEYYGAEVRSKHFYGYGDYQVRMKPAKISGTASTFFVCTGPYDQWYNESGEVVKQNHHDEIDIEFLGKDTTKVQFNYFADGKGGHEYMYDLGFDASEEYHDYGFRWTENDITWFVDDKPVYQVLRSKIRAGESWPEEPGRLIMNYWCGTENAEGWMGKFNDDYSGHADYEWVKCSAEAKQDPNLTKPGTPKPDPDPTDELNVPTEGWTAIDTTSFDGWGNYTVDLTNGISVSHTEERSGWKCCGMPLANSYSWVKFHVKNNAQDAAVMRIDLKKEGGNNGVEAVKINGTVTLNPLESAINLTLAAGEEADVVAKIKDMTIDQMVIFLNSTGEGQAASGNITISDLSGIAAGGQQGDPDPDPQPVDGWQTMNLSLATWNNNYTVSNAAGKAVIAHTKEVVDRYVNCNMGVTLTSENNTIKLVIKNNGTEPAFVKVGVQDASYNCVLSAASINGVAQDAASIQYGASKTLAAGEEVTFIIVVDLTKNPTTLFIALNSENELGTNAATGNISINAYHKVEEEEK